MHDISCERIQRSVYSEFIMKNKMTYRYFFLYDIDSFQTATFHIKFSYLGVTSPKTSFKQTSCHYSSFSFYQIDHIFLR